MLSRKVLYLLAAILVMARPCSGSILFHVNEQEGDDSLSTDVLVEQAGDDLKFTLTVVDLINTGDLRGIFFHVANEALLSGLSAAASPGFVLGNSQEYDANSVANMGGGNPNINPLGPFDAGIEIGTGNGAGGPDDYQTFMFLLSHSSLSLDVSTFFPTSAAVGGDGFVMGIRAQTVGADGGLRGGSSKQGAGDPMIVPDPPGDSGGATPEPTAFLIWAFLATAAAARFRHD
jgi:hypothetical protein